MFLVLAADTDPVAAAVATHLPADATVWLTPSDLLRAGWVHRVEDSAASFNWRLGGLSIDSGEVTAALNRLQWLPTVPMGNSRDRDYAAFEWHALLMSALHCLQPRVINPAYPPSLAGPRRSGIEALARLRQQGWAVRRTSATTDGRAHPRSGWQVHPWQPWLQPGEGVPEAAPPSPVPIGRRPVVWTDPLPNLRTCWLVAGEVFGGTALDPPDLAGAGTALGCPLVRLELADTEAGPVIAGVDTFPVGVPPTVAAAVARWMRSRG